MPEIHVDALIYEEDGVVVAHALQFDIVSTGDSIQDAVNDLTEACQAQLEYAIKHKNMDNLFRPAPPDVWDNFFEAQRVRSQRKTQTAKPDAKGKKKGTKIGYVAQILPIPA